MTSTVRAGLIGASIGGASVFLLDPDRGARRRALIRDKALRVTRKTRDAADATARDVNNRLSGVQSRVADESVDDPTLEARVRAVLGRVTPHLRAMSVHVTDGLVRLTGDALASETPAIVSAVSGVPGVLSVRNNMRTHASADGIPALQGGSPRPGQWTGWIRGAWSPTAIVAAGAGLAAGAVILTAVRGRADGDSHATGAAPGTRTLPPAPVEEGAALFMTESGIVSVVPDDDIQDW